MEVIQGTLDMLVLKTLALEPMHGLGISRRIQQITGGVAAAMLVLQGCAVTPAGPSVMVLPGAQNGVGRQANRVHGLPTANGRHAVMQGELVQAALMVAERLAVQGRALDHGNPMLEHVMRQRRREVRRGAELAPAPEVLDDELAFANSGLAVVAVFVYNRVQERQARTRAAQRRGVVRGQRPGVAAGGRCAGNGRHRTLRCPGRAAPR